MVKFTPAQKKVIAGITNHIAILEVISGVKISYDPQKKINPFIVTCYKADALQAEIMFSLNTYAYELYIRSDSKKNFMPENSAITFVREIKVMYACCRSLNKVDLAHRNMWRMTDAKQKRGGMGH